MKLDALPRRDPERAVGTATGQVVEREILRRGQTAAGNAHAHHELPVLAVAALLQFGGAVAVIALIDAVKLEQAVPGIVERVGGIGEVARQIAAQLPALLLYRFGFGEGLDLGHFRLSRRGHCR